MTPDGNRRLAFAFRGGPGVRSIMGSADRSGSCPVACPKAQVAGQGGRSWAGWLEIGARLTGRQLCLKSGCFRCSEGCLIPEYGVGDGQEFAGQRDRGDLGGIVGVVHAVGLFAQGSGVAPKRQGGRAHQPAHHLLPGPDVSLAPVFATLVRLGRKASQRSYGVAVQKAQLGQPCQQTRRRDRASIRASTRSVLGRFSDCATWHECSGLRLT